MDDEKEIVLSELDNQELFELMQDDLYDGYAAEIVEEVNEALKRNITPYDILNQGLVAGMDIVGEDFRDGILFVPEVMMAAKAMKAGMNILRPLLVETGAPKLGTAIIGTVKGDIHDIGQNLVSMMWEGAGLEVHNIGTNNSVEDYLDAMEKYNADIIGMSALLTTTMPYMKVVIDTLKEIGKRDDVIVLVGGAPLSEAFAEDIEADAYCKDASEAVVAAKKFLALRKSLQQR